jgi:hypothetical protein
MVAGTHYKNSMMQSGHRHFFVAIETDATRYHGSSAARPRLLAKNEAEQLLAHLATDLEGLLPGFAQFSIATVGALFDQTQVLRPGYPVCTALESALVMAGNFPDVDPGRPARISLGAQDSRMPAATLHPEESIPLGILQLLPVTVSGDATRLAELGTAMEDIFMQAGQVSAHTARWLESAFAIKINHARFMTLLDLNAMFRLQLEHFGFLPLWQLLDAALNGQEEECEVASENGQVYTWRNGAVHTTFETFDYWSQSGGGMHVASFRGSLAGAYAAWTRTMRQYLTTLAAHQVSLEFFLPGVAQEALAGSFFVETITRAAAGRCAEVTEHSFAELGSICVSVVVDGQQHNYYPLRPQGLNDIQQAIRQRGLGGKTVSFPGTILYDERNRSLLAEPLSGSQRP